MKVSTTVHIGSGAKRTRRPIRSATYEQCDTKLERGLVRIVVSSLLDAFAISFRARTVKETVGMYLTRYLNYADSLA